MKDLVVVAITVAFFAVAVAYVALCDRIIGPDEQPDVVDTTTEDAEPAAVAP